MSVLKAYRLKFLSKATLVRSYTLFGAICWACELLGKDLKNLLHGFEKGNPPFLISDPMPLAKSADRELLLFPKPVLPVMKEFRREDDICLKKDRKKIKKAKYVTFKVLKKVLEGEVLEEVDLMDKEEFKVSNNIISLADESPEFKDENALSVRNILNRINMRSENLFTEDYHLFSDRFFLLWFKDEGYEDTVEECLSIIEDNGLGANKNLGWGKVKIEPLEGFDEEFTYLSRKVMQSAKRFITLSPVIPQRGTLDFKDSYYTLEVYKSPTDNTFGGPFIWKRKVIYLKEGSVLKNPKSEGFVGRLKETKAGDFRVFQYGYEFPLEVRNYVQA